MRDSTITQKKTPKHVVVIANISIPAEANKLSCVLTTSYIVFMFTQWGCLTLKLYYHSDLHKITIYTSNDLLLPFNQKLNKDFV